LEFLSVSVSKVRVKGVAGFCMKRVKSFRFKW
jgi:hypothetical protein